MICEIVGRFGSGKTLLLTYYALKAIEKNHKVFANYTIKSDKASFVTPSNFEVKLDSVDTQKQPISTFLDEVYVWLDSRMSMTKRNLSLSHLILQSRKRHLTIFYTAQMSRTVEMRLSEMADFRIKAEQLHNRFKYTVYTGDGLQLSVFAIPKKKAETFLYSEYDTYHIVKEKNYVSLRKFQTL